MGYKAELISLLAGANIFLFNLQGKLIPAKKWI